jgi:predicted enzyme related to lactoylglutathione lyase
MPIPRALDTASSQWTIYLGVEDVDASAAKARELGGTVLQEPSDYAGYKFAYLQDPGGAQFFIIAS